MSNATAVGNKLPMFKFILSAYINTSNLLAKKPQAILLLVFVTLVNISLSSAAAKFEQGGLNNDLLSFLSQLIACTLNVYLYWLVFYSENISTLSLYEWFKKYYPRSLLQYFGGIILFLPLYAVLRVIFGEDGLAVQLGHTILIVSISVWIFIAMDLGILWLCFRNEGFLRNVKNAIKDAFRNCGYYLFLRLIVLAFTYLSQVVQSGFATFTGLACGLLVFTSILISVSWIALVFGFLGLRRREQINLIQGGVQKEESHAS